MPSQDDPDIGQHPGGPSAAATLADSAVHGARPPRPGAHGKRPWLIGLAVLVLLAVAARTIAWPLVRRFLEAPDRCGINSGCVQTTPLVASLVMFGFDALVAGLIVWHVRARVLDPSPVWSDGGDASAAPPGAGRAAAARARGHARFRQAGLAWPLGLVIVLALAARAFRPGGSPFRWDEAQMSWLALHGMLDGRLALTGIDTTARIPNMHASVYLVAPLLVPFQSGPGSEAALLSFAVAMSLATTLLCAWVVRRWTGSTAAGLATGLAYALGFWPVWVGRRAWQNDFMPLFSALFLDAVLVVAVRRQGRGFTWAAVWLAVLTQLHFVALSMLPLLAVAAWLGRKGLRITDLVLGVLLAAVLSAPYLYWEFSVFNLLRDVRQAMVVSGQPSSFDLTSVQQTLDLASAGGLEWWTTPQWRALADATGVARPLAAAGALLFCVGVLLCGAAAVRGRTRDTRIAAAFLAASVGLPVVLLMRHTVEVYWWYLFPWLPSIAALIGIGAVWPARALSSRFAGRDGRAQLRGAAGSVLALRWAGLALLAAYGGGSLLVMDRLLVLATTDGPMSQYEPVQPALEIGPAARAAWLASSPNQPLLIGGLPRDADRMWLSVGPRTPVQQFDDCRELPASNGSGSSERVYLVRDESPAAARLLASPGVRLVAAVPRATDQSPFRVFAASPGAVQAQTFGADTARQFPDCAARGQP